MYITTSLTAAALLLLLLRPLGVSSQATPQQTIVPFSTLPACAAKCGPLFDAQGACSPPVVPTSSVSCFCKYASLQPFYTSATAVCPAACPQDPNGLTGIQSWFLGLCGNGGTQPTTAGSTPTTGGTGTSTAVPVNGGSGSGGTPSNSSTHNSWISNHWQWIVMIVVILLAIIIGWIVACLLRRRYIRRKEREFELRPPAAPWVPGAGTAHPTGPGAPSPYAEGGVLSKGKNRESEMFVSRPPSAALGAFNEKSESGERKKKKWVVKERT